MGQLISILLGARRRPRAPTPRLLQIPVEVLLLIIEQLRENPESILALALTSKGLLDILISEVPPLGKAVRKPFLRLLERDVGHKYYFCCLCSRLHPFSTSWGPLDYKQNTVNGRGAHRVDGFADTFFTLNSHYNLNFHLARLVMNRHFYGDPAGIPLQNLNTHMTGHEGTWQLIWAAKIIDDELFMRIEHKFCNFRKGHTDHSLRTIIDQRFARRICDHIHSSSKTISESNTKDGIDGAFVECRNVKTSCTMCLTDITTTVERKEVREKRLRDGSLEWYEPRASNQKLPSRISYLVTITGYHQLGSCRSPNSWKWKAITGDPLARTRDETIYPPGSVRKKWRAARGAS